MIVGCELCTHAEQILKFSISLILRYTPMNDCNLVLGKKRFMMKSYSETLEKGTLGFGNYIR